VIGQDATTGNEDISFTFQKIRYVYDAQEKKMFEEVKLPTQLSIRQYLDCKGYQDDEELKQAEKLYSKNKFVFTFYLFYVYYLCVFDLITAVG